MQFSGSKTLQTFFTAHVALLKWTWLARKNFCLEEAGCNRQVPMSFVMAGKGSNEDLI